MVYHSTKKRNIAFGSQQKLHLKLQEKLQSDNFIDIGIEFVQENIEKQRKRNKLVRLIVI